MKTSRPIFKITLSGMLVALIIILTRSPFITIQNIAIIPFVRISLGPSLIIFSSLLLGPVYGGIIGGLSDLLGIILVNNGTISILITLVYTLLGIAPWFIFKGLGKIKNESTSMFITFGFIVAMFIFTTTYVFLNDAVVSGTKTYSFEMWKKILFTILTFILGAGSILGLFIINKMNASNKKEIFDIALTSVLCEFFILLLLNSLVKTHYFGMKYELVLFCQGLVFFVNILLDTFMCLLLRKISKKYIK